jgi:hypothetical protein
MNEPASYPPSLKSKAKKPSMLLIQRGDRVVLTAVKVLGDNHGLANGAPPAPTPAPAPILADFVSEAQQLRVHHKTSSRFSSESASSTERTAWRDLRDKTLSSIIKSRTREPQLHRRQELYHRGSAKWSALTWIAHSVTTSSILVLKRQCLLCRKPIHFGTPLSKHCRLNRLMADEIPYWEYTFLAEYDWGSDGFKVYYGDHFWADKDENE